MTLQIYFWGQLQLVMVLDKNYDRESPATVILGAHMLDVARLLRQSWPTQVDKVGHCCVQDTHRFSTHRWYTMAMIIMNADKSYQQVLRALVLWGHTMHCVPTIPL